MPNGNKTEEALGPEQNLTDEEKYRKLVDEANRDDPWKEPIKDLIDKYADIADQNQKQNEQRVIEKF